MKNDPLCIKEDVCDMAVCDGVSSCSHAVLKSAVLAQQSNNNAMAAILALYKRWESTAPKVQYVWGVQEFIRWAQEQHQ